MPRAVLRATIQDVGASIAPERESFERLVAETAYRPLTATELRAELERQLAYQPEPSAEGLDELAGLLATWLSGDHDESAVAALADSFPHQPLVHFYGYAMRREAGDLDGAAASLAALGELDPHDPHAIQLAAALAGTTVAVMSLEERLANIAKVGTTPLLLNPYQLAVGAVYDVIRDRETARVLDVGVGSGAQLGELLAVLGTHEHRVRRLELVGLDFVDEFLERAGERIAATAAPEGTKVVWTPVHGRIEELDEAQVREIHGTSGVTAVNASISLHEVPGERKLTALRNVHRVSPEHVFLAEWNYCLENTLPPTSVDFMVQIRSASAAFVAALTERYPHGEARAFVRDWLSQGSGQMTCPAAERQECFLHVASWRALLEQAGFRIAPVADEWIAHAESGHRASVEGDGTWIATCSYGGWAPIVLQHAVPA